MRSIIFIKIMSLILLCHLVRHAQGQSRSSISIVPGIQYGYSSFSVKYGGYAIPKYGFGSLEQINLGLNIPYSYNLSVKLNGFFNSRNGSISFLYNGNPKDSADISKYITRNLGVSGNLEFTKYYKKGRAFYAGLGVFYSTAVGGKFDSGLLVNHKTLILVSRKLKFGNNTEDDLGKINSGLVLTTGYKFSRTLCVELFYNLGTANLIPAYQVDTKHTSARTQDFGLKLSYFIKTD